MDVELAIIGGGVVGLAVARELAQRGRQVMLLERNLGLAAAENQSSRNSGVIHAGIYYDQATRPLKAALCPAGARRLHEFCAAHGVPHARCGKLVLAAARADLPGLEALAAQCARNGVEARIISGEEARAMEPGARAVKALHVPGSGVVEPTSLVAALAAAAAKAGAELITGAELRGVDRREEGLMLDVGRPDGTADSLLAGRLINCAGLEADSVARMVNPDSAYNIDPMRGEAYCFDRMAVAHAPRMNLYPTPLRVALPGGLYWTVGVHLTPILERADALGRWRMARSILVGPLNFAAGGRVDYGGDMRPAAEFGRAVRGFFPGLADADLRPYQVGVQARLAGHQDWVIALDPAEPRCLNLLGLDSPALSACLAIAELAADMLA